MHDRLMTARQLATYLSLNERTVLKLVAEGTLPGVKLGSQWRFRKAMIDTWLDDQMLGVAPRPQELGRVTGKARQLLGLASCFRVEHILPELAATRKLEVVEELASLAFGLELVRDKNWFMGALLERENVMPSATGNGIAFLHTLRRNPDRVVRPFMVLGRSRAGVDFDALDGNPTHLFFVLGLKYDELHMPWLQKLAQILVQPGNVAALLAAGDAEEIYRLLIAAEQHLVLAPG
jgi:excisionase family DNA binding protein